MGSRFSILLRHWEDGVRLCAGPQRVGRSLVVVVTMGGRAELASEPDRLGSNPSSVCTWASGLSFLVCKLGIIIVSASQGSWRGLDRKDNVGSV